MTPQQIEIELKKLTELPPWGRKQGEDWDKLSSFVYQKPSYEELYQQINALKKDAAFEHYCVLRWFNTLSTMALEEIFCSNPKVKANKNKYEKLIDFSLKSVPFDHKISLYPRNYPDTQAYAEENPASLIEWLYDNQNKDGKYHAENRLFVMLYAADGQHWRLRAEVAKMSTEIGNYIQHFDKNKLTMLTLSEGSTILSDIIWIKL